MDGMLVRFLLLRFMASSSTSLLLVLVAPKRQRNWQRWHPCGWGWWFRQFQAVILVVPMKDDDDIMVVHAMAVFRRTIVVTMKVYVIPMMVPILIGIISICVAFSLYFSSLCLCLAPTAQTHPFFFCFVSSFRWDVLPTKWILVYCCVENWVISLVEPI